MQQLANGLRYAPSGVLVGGTRPSHFAGANFKPRKTLENAHAAKQQSHHASPGVRPGVGCILIPVIVRDAVLARSPKMAESITALSPWKPIHSEYEPKNHTNGREARDRDYEPIDPTKVVV